MKIASLASLFLCLLPVLVTAWDPGDHALFQLNDAVRAHEGPNVTFYDLIGVTPNATHAEIKRAYTKTAARLHPDKARQAFVANYGKPKKGQKSKVHKKPSKGELDAFYKEANKRFQRLSVVGEVLRGEQRERYDFFLQNGFPKWRGTGYYYSRYRPGLGTVLIGLLVFGGGFAHYGLMHLSYKRQRDFMSRYIRHARQVAWGNDAGLAGIPGINGSAAPATGFESVTAGDEQAQNWTRRQKRMQAKEDKKAAKNPKAVKAAKEKGISTPVEAEMISGAQGAKKRVVAENGKVLIVDSVGNVYLEEETAEGEVHEFLLDVDEIPRPLFSNTFMVKLPIWAYRKSVGRLVGHGEQPIVGEEINAASPEDVAIKHATAANQNSEARKRKPIAR